MNVCLKIIITWKFIARKNFWHEYSRVYMVDTVLYSWKWWWALHQFCQFGPKSLHPIHPYSTQLLKYCCLRTINSTPQARNIKYYLWEDTESHRWCLSFEISPPALCQPTQEDGRALSQPACTYMYGINDDIIANVWPPPGEVSASHWSVGSRLDQSDDRCTRAATHS